MNKKTTIILLSFIMIYLVGAFSVLGQTNKVHLENKRVTIKMENQPLGLVFRYLMENYDIPIGFEESILDRGHSDYNFHTNLPGIATHYQQSSDGSVKMTTTSETVFKAKIHPITLDFENGRLIEIFNQIVEQMNNYKWEINDGVVNIYPMKGRDERFKDLLELQIKNFTFEKGQTVEDITTSIMVLPEFRTFLKENNFQFSGFRTGVSFAVNAQYGKIVNEEMKFSNLTFRELLNKITKIKKGGWILKEKYLIKTTGKELIDLDI